VTILATAVDSLNLVIGHRDSLLAALRARLDSLVAAPPDTIVRFATPAYLPVPPWYESALAHIALGGLLTIAAGFGAQWFRVHLDDRKKRTQLKRRILTTLGAAIITPNVTSKRDETQPIELRPFRGLLVDWQRYDRVSDDLGVIGNPALEDKIDATLGVIRMVADKVIAEEEMGMRERKTVGPGTLSAELEDRTRRKKLLALVKGMAAEAHATLVKCNREWPPPPWHQLVGQTQRADQPPASQTEQPPTPPEVQTGA
jgi:hypothetical protein